MKNFKLYLNPFLLSGIFLVFFLYACDKSDRLPDPKIQAGVTKISGKITNFKLKVGEEAPVMTLSVPNVITAEGSTYETLLKEDGSFQFEFPIECSPTIVYLHTQVFGDNYVSIPVLSDEVANVEIIIEDNGNKIKVLHNNKLKLTSDDMVNSFDMVGKFLDGGDNVSTYALTPEEFSRFAIDTLIPKRLKRSFNDSILSDRGKAYVNNECRLLYLKGALLSYKEYNELNYKNFKPKDGIDSFKPQIAPRSYYAFLKEFNLNNPQYLYNYYYSVVFQRLLENKTLNIPPINEKPVNDWLKEVKPILADLVGFNDGLFYDMLVAHAYNQQFTEELKPLSGKQIDNIKDYFNNSGIANVLLRKKIEVSRLNNEKKQFKTEKNPTPSVVNEKLMAEIIAKYKGKVAIVDFWASWCQPCMAAMQEIIKVKGKFIGKEVVFIYITNPSTPRDVWEKKVKLIGGEHYYLTQEEWEYILESNDFDAIPTYLFYDAKGSLKNKITGYPGSEKMKSMIDELLP